MSSRISKSAVLKKAFGITEEGLVNFPSAISGTQISRIHAVRHGETSFGFPHGVSTSNSHLDKDLRCWKRYRKTQYRPTDIG